MDYGQIAAAFPEVIGFTETPVLRTAPTPLFLLSRLVRQSGYKVVLTGEGADEFLAGYDIFREDRVRRFWARDPDSTLRPRLLERLYPWLARSPAQAKALQRTFFDNSDYVNQQHEYIPAHIGNSFYRTLHTSGALASQYITEPEPSAGVLPALRQPFPDASAIR